jgi:4-hydroxy-tetrahydrodipicolinate reductase
VAEGLAMTVDEIEEEIDPVLATAEVRHGGRTIPAGRVLGVHHVARAFEEGREVVRLTLQISLGAERPRDWARIEADPPLSLEIPGGVAGEAATAWALVNAAPRVAAAEPGLLTVLDLPAGR